VIVGTFDKVSEPDPLSELPTTAETAGTQSEVCDLCLYWVVSISIKHFDIFNLSIRIPLNSMVFSILKFKIENNKDLLLKLKHRLLRKLGVFSFSFSFHQILTYP
jgi:hypothetical protein